MLTGLSIRDVVLIEALDLEFDSGLGVLTGETGAGKSILLDALGLALGISLGASVLGVLSVVWQAVKLPPAEAMRPEPPADFKPSVLERIGLTGLFSPAFRMALRNIERRPWQALFTCCGIALANNLRPLARALILKASIHSPFMHSMKSALAMSGNIPNMSINI